MFRTDLLSIIRSTISQLYFGKELYMFRTDLLSIIRSTISQLYFGKELYMFRTDLLSIIRSLNTAFTAIGICHTSYVDCLLASPDLTSRPNKPVTLPRNQLLIRYAATIPVHTVTILCYDTR